MKPTQAQIEVAAWRECAEYDAMMDGPRFKGWNRSALDRCRKKFIEDAAAAEAGYSEPQGTGFQAGEAEPAAAEAGNTWPAKLVETRIEETINATIERCAQVLDEKSRRTQTAAKAAYEDGAAAIRAVAAAEAGEQEMYEREALLTPSLRSAANDKFVHDKNASAAQKALIAATIERCAQRLQKLAVRYRGTEPIELAPSESGEAISWLFAAAIRAMKEECL